MPQLTLFYSSQAAAENEAAQALAELEKPFKCTECDSSFTTNAALNIHSKTHIKGQKLKCSICPFITNDYNELRKHRLNDTCMGKQKLFRCHACDFICHSKPMMKTHFFSAHTDPDKLHECPDCDFKALKINALNIHVKQQHSAPMEYACTSCDFVCNSQNVIKNHIIKRHSDENIDIDGDQEGSNEIEGEQNITNINKYACASCDYMCSSMAQIKIHISENHSIDSPIKSTNLQGLDEPLEPSPEKTQVSRNLMNFEEPATERYTREPLSKDLPFIRKFSCRECDFQCLKKRGIEVHMSRVHKFTEQAPKHRDKLREVDYELEPIPIGNHPDPGKEKINSHDERRMYKCPLCKFKGTLFGFKIHRNNHMSRKCKTCGVKCKSEKSLLKHMKSHSGYSCNLCDFHCETEMGFESHMDLSHNTATKRFSCPKCSYKCNTQMDLRRHVSVHEPQKQFTCPECEDSYDEKSELMHHMLSMNHTGGKPFPCTKCKAQFLTESGLKIHLESHEPEPDLVYSDEEMEEEFVVDEYGDRIEVDEYGDKIDSSPGRRNSSSPRKVINDYDEDYDDEEDEEYEDENVCDECGFEGTKQQLKKHKNSHRKIHRANNVRKTNLLRCFYNGCEFRSHSYSGLQLHIKSHGESEKKERLRCAHPSCDYMSITVKGMLLHGKMIHQSFALEEHQAAPAPVTHSPIKVDTIYNFEGKGNEYEMMDKCPKCDYFGTLKGLKVHLRVHTAVKSYRCKECDFKCLTEDALDTHITDTHGTDEFACKECKYKGISIVGFARHYSRVHNIVISYDKENAKEKSFLPYSCDLCDKYIGPTARGLNKHKQNMHSDELTQNNPENVSEQQSIEKDNDISGGINEEASGDNQVSCSKCDFKGKTLQEIRKHILRMHSVKVIQKVSKNNLLAKTPEINEKGKEDKSFACDVCDYVGNYKGLRSHMKAHSKDPFSCPECDFKCLKGKVLDQHIKKKHDKKKCNHCDYVGSAKGLKSHSKAHTREKPFACKECEFKCLTQKVLDTHVQRTHGSMEFTCSMCNYKGSSAQGLNIHSIKLHNIKVPINEQIDSQKENVPVNESCSENEEEISPDNENSFDNISPDNESCLEDDKNSPEKEPCNENEEISSKKESCSENKEVTTPKRKTSLDNKEKKKDTVIDNSQDATEKTPSEKRVRQVNPKYSIKDYFIQGSTPKHEHTERQSKMIKKDDKESKDEKEKEKHTERQSKRLKKDHEESKDEKEKEKHTERQSKRLKKDHEESKDEKEKEKLNESASQESPENVNKQPENKEQLGNNEAENTPSRPKRIKLSRNNTPGNANNNKEEQKKDIKQKVSPNEEDTLRKVNKAAKNKTQLANKSKKEQKENDDSKEQKSESNNLPNSVTDKKVVRGKGVHKKDSPGKICFLQNVDKKKKFDEYLKKQGSKPNGVKNDRKNIKREKGLTCLCLECGARFTAKDALEKHMIIHL